MRYTIKVLGLVDKSWSDWFDGMEISVETGGDTGWITTLSGNVQDQADLRGIANHLWDLNLTLLSIERNDLPMKPAETY